MRIEVGAMIRTLAAAGGPAAVAEGLRLLCDRLDSIGTGEDGKGTQHAAAFIHDRDGGRIHRYVRLADSALADAARRRTETPVDAARRRAVDALLGRPSAGEPEPVAAADSALAATVRLAMGYTPPEAAGGGAFTNARSRVEIARKEAMAAQRLAFEAPLGLTETQKHAALQERMKRPMPKGFFHGPDTQENYPKRKQGLGDAAEQARREVMDAQRKMFEAPLGAGGGARP